MATITITDLAADLATDPRTARKFMRSITPADAQPGKGSRWAIEKRQVRSLKTQFKAFTADAEAKAALKAASAADDADEVIEVEDDTVDA